MSKPADFVNEILQKKILSVAELAGIMGVDPSTLWRYRKNPSLIRAEQIAKIQDEVLKRTAKSGIAIAAQERREGKRTGGMNEMEIREKLINAERILKSRTGFADALSQNIQMFLIGLDLLEKERGGNPRVKESGGQT